MDETTVCQNKIRRTMNKVIIVLLIPAICGCAIYRHQKATEMKRLLAAAGFDMRFADTKEKLAQLKELPQHKLVAQNWSGKELYVYADAEICKCAYVGNEEAYKRFQELARQRLIDEEDRLATEREKAAETDWGGWRFDKSW